MRMRVRTGMKTRRTLLQDDERSERSLVRAFWREGAGRLVHSPTRGREPQEQRKRTDIQLDRMAALKDVVQLGAWPTAASRLK